MRISDWSSDVCSSDLMGGSQRLTRAVGKAKAMEMCLTGRMMNAREAESANLVARVVPESELLADALSTAATIAAMPPMAAMINKEMVKLRSEEHTSELQSLMHISYAVFCLKTKRKTKHNHQRTKTNRKKHNTAK